MHCQPLRSSGVGRSFRRNILEPVRYVILDATHTKEENQNQMTLHPEPKTSQRKPALPDKPDEDVRLP